MAYAAPAVAQQSNVAVHDGEVTSATDDLLSRRITLDLVGISLKRAIDSTSSLARVLIQYQVDVLEKYSTPINLHVTHVPLAVALEQLLDGTGLHAVSDSHGKLTLVTSESEMLADSTPPTNTVTGRVIDSTSGRGLVGATVKVAGTKIVGVTSDSGRFTLRGVKIGSQLINVRLFGYRPVERTITVVGGEPVVVRISLEVAPNVLSGVITTATGIQRRVEVGNDITTLNVDSIRQIAPIMSVTDLLETRVPGLTVLHSSGEPGDPSRLRLRGVGSISGNNDPVIIVDGVRVYSNQSDPRNDNLAPPAKLGNSSQLATPTGRFSSPSPIDQIDPNSIETIDIFKGPSASSLYGSDAASGVIVITTKHGHVGPTHWSLDLGQGVNWIPGKWPMNYFRFGANVVGYGPLCNWYDPTCIVDSVRTFQALNDPRYTVLSRGSDQTANLTISGGTTTLLYSLSGTASGQIGNLRLPVSEQQRYAASYGPISRRLIYPDKYTTWGVTGSLTAMPWHTLHATLQSSLFSSAKQTSPLSGAIQQLQGVYISGGYVSGPPSLSGLQGLNPLSTTPLVTNYAEDVTSDGVTSSNALNLTWQPQVWLPITATGGIQTMQRIDKTYTPYGVSPSGPQGCSSGVMIVNCEDTTGFYGLGRGLSHNQTLTVGTVIPFFRQRVSTALGGNYYNQVTNDFQASADQLAPGVSQPASFFVAGCTSGCGTATQNASSSATYGYYLEPRLNLSSRFFAAPGFRLDGGSGGTHASTSGGAVGGLSAFPKLDFSFIAIDRQGSRPLWDVLTLLRPRIAFGLAGTQPAPEYRLRLFNTAGTSLTPGGEGSLANSTDGIGCSSTVMLNGITVPAVCLNSLGNSQLHPERSSELEGGVDATLWSGRLIVTMTRYNKTRKDAIITLPIAPSISALDGTQFNMAVNIGEVRNTGTELTADAILLESRALSWNVGMNLSNNNNVLVHLNPGYKSDYYLGLVPGYPLFGNWVKPIRYFADLNHDHVIEGNEVIVGDSSVFAGESNPKYQLNLNTQVTLFNGRLSMNATFAYQNGLAQTNQAALNSSSFYLLGNNPGTPLSYQAAVMAATGWCGVNGTTGCSPTTNYGLIQTVNTFRFQTLSVNYNLPKEISSWLRVPHARIGLQGANLGLHTNYRGKDPNVNAFSTVSSVDKTADLGQVPDPRIWWLKLTLGN